MLSKDFFHRLEMPFPIADISVRIGTKKKDNSAAMPLFYLQADAVRNRLDCECAVEGAVWSYDFEVIASTEKTLAVKATIIITKDNHSIARSSIGEELFAKEDNTEVYKSAETDAFKRAAARFGVGGYLRTLEKLWFSLNERGYFVDPEEEIVKKVYSKSGVKLNTDSSNSSSNSSSNRQTIEQSLQSLNKAIDAIKPTLKNPPLFFDESFVTNYEKEKGLKKGSWWSIQSVLGVPVRHYTVGELHALADIIGKKINEDNALDALVLSKVLPVALQYPEHFGNATK